MPIKKNKSYRKAKYVIYKETLIDFKEHIWAFIGSFLGLATISLLNYELLDSLGFTLLIGSFGATCVLIYGAVNSPLAQPRNLFLGHIISAIIGVTCFKLLPNLIWLAAPLSVSLSIILMQMLKALHPPGGATALIAVTGGPTITNLGYFYVLSPVLTGVIILFLFALICNNVPKNRKYPIKSIFKKRSQV